LDATQSAPRSTLSPSTTLFRSQLNADKLDLTQARIRCENLLSINATNLIGNSNSIFDAPLINYRLITTNPVLTVDSLVGSSVRRDRKSTRLNSSHEWISYAVFC